MLGTLKNQTIRSARLYVHILKVRSVSTSHPVYQKNQWHIFFEPPQRKITMCPPSSLSLAASISIGPQNSFIKTRGTTNRQNQGQPRHLGALNAQEYLDSSLRIMAILARVKRSKRPPFLEATVVA